MSEPNRVSVSLGFTKNMGDFESLRVDVGLSSDRMDGESTVEAYRRVKDFVKSALLEAVNEAVAEIEG